jgi:hypothetical protein
VAKRHIAHFSKPGRSFGFTACGIVAGENKRTSDLKMVTCKSCRGSVVYRELKTGWSVVGKCDGVKVGGYPEQKKRVIIVTTKPLTQEQSMVFMDTMQERFPEWMQ